MPVTIIIGSEEWQTFVANAIAKDPAKRTECEKKAIHIEYSTGAYPTCRVLFVNKEVTP